MKRIKTKTNYIHLRFVEIEYKSFDIPVCLKQLDLAASWVEGITVFQRTVPRTKKYVWLILSYVYNMFNDDLCNWIWQTLTTLKWMDTTLTVDLKELIRRCQYSRKPIIWSCFQDYTIPKLGRIIIRILWWRTKSIIATMFLVLLEMTSSILLPAYPINKMVKSISKRIWAWPWASVCKYPAIYQYEYHCVIVAHHPSNTVE